MNNKTIMLSLTTTTNPNNKNTNRHNNSSKYYDDNQQQQQKRLVSRQSSSTILLRIVILLLVTTTYTNCSSVLASSYFSTTSFGFVLNNNYYPKSLSLSSSISKKTTKKDSTTTSSTRSSGWFLRTASVSSSSSLFSTTVKKSSAESSSTSSSSSSSDYLNANTIMNANSVYVAKQGGRGVVTASQQAIDLGLSLGAPPVRPRGGHYVTKGGIQVTAHIDRLLFTPQDSTPGTTTTTTTIGTSSSEQTTTPSNMKSSTAAIEELIDMLDSHRGVLLTSSYEFPGRYARWSLGFVDPPIQITGQVSTGTCIIEALNQRGIILMPAIIKAMKQLQNDGILSKMDITMENNDSLTPKLIRAYVVPLSDVGTFSEEDRSRQPSLFSVIRSLVDLFGYDGDCKQLGLYGSFGYDLTFQFEPIKLQQNRDMNQRDLLLYLPDQIVVVDQAKHDAWKVSYDFVVDSKSTQGTDRTGSINEFQPYDETSNTYIDRDTPKNTFAESVEKAKREFAVGNLFEAVLSQTFREKLSSTTPPSILFRRLRSRNPAPYGFFLNLGQQEYMVGASPEMFVRCEATNDNDYRPGAIRVETCPISGTVARGADALEDAQRVKSLMMNGKEESELTMCTDVDRNDKSRICEPGSVQVIGRRQIEMYSRLIHTVDHVEGYLRPQFDALDAFLCHTWAVTVTGAPKTWAIQFIENTERSPRCWYGGAVGMIGFDGSLNTGLTLRTVRVKDGIAEVRAGATLLYDSSPPAEELETELKASAMLDAIVQSDEADETDNNNNMDQTITKPKRKKKFMVGQGMNIILVDHEDSFVHTLGNYLRQTGANVSTLRSGASALRQIEALVEKNEKPDLVVLSPGPGNPSDFGLSKTIDVLIKHKIPCFGVCLGLQGMVEHFGGTLGVLSYPMHGKPSPIFLTPAGRLSESSIFAGLPESFEVARYHSLHGIKDLMPSCLEITALSEDGIVMAIQHKELPFAAVQFHPESILTSPAHGMTILQNALSLLKYNNNEENDDSNNDMSSSNSHDADSSSFKSMSVTELKAMLTQYGISTTGAKTDLVQKANLVQQARKEARDGKLLLDNMTVPELRQLKKNVGLKGTYPSRSKLLDALKTCLL